MPPTVPVRMIRDPVTICRSESIIAVIALDEKAARQMNNPAAPDRRKILWIPLFINTPRVFTYTRAHG
jgi:hypothetical protein